VYTSRTSYGIPYTCSGKYKPQIFWVNIQSICGDIVFMPSHGNISVPFQSQHFPLPSTPTVLTTSIIFSTENSGENNFSTGVLPQNSSLSPVFTVPGCRLTHIALSPHLCLKKISTLFAILFTAALLARYEYQPPRELSLVEPTRADINASTAEVGRFSRGETMVDFFGRRGVKCLARRRGPRLLI
jgi:hypothetical protein